MLVEFISVLEAMNCNHLEVSQPYTLIILQHLQNKYEGPLQHLA